MKILGKTIGGAALASMVALPLLAGASQADAATCHTRKLNGTLLGAAGGALLGSAVSHGSTGPIVGGLAGAVVGREIGRSGCDRHSYRTSYNRRTYYRSYQPAPAHYYGAAPYAQPARQVYYNEYGSPVVVERWR
jgi:uncharacterized protein YcfJ